MGFLMDISPLKNSSFKELDAILHKLGLRY